MKNMRSFLSSLLLLVCLLCGTSSAFAQGTNLGSIRGRVTDQAGAAVDLDLAGAEIEVARAEGRAALTAHLAPVPTPQSLGGEDFGAFGGKLISIIIMNNMNIHIMKRKQMPKSFMMNMPVIIQKTF